MINKRFQIVNSLQHRLKISDRQLAARAKISRTTLHNLILGTGNPTVETIDRISADLKRKAQILLLPEHECASMHSTVAASIQVANGGDWRIFFLNLVDEFRRTLDPRLMLLPPVRLLAKRETALLASIVCQLCLEQRVEIPEWATRNYYLKEPWFVSGIESLKASALMESPLPFRWNNIFVLGNFLDRV